MLQELAVQGMSDNSLFVLVELVKYIVKLLQVHFHFEIFKMH